MIFTVLNSNASAQEKFVLIVAFAAAAMTSIMFHEYAHAFVALKNGDLTAKLSGRLNLNPRSHFDLFGLIMFFIVGFGWAKPVPINPDNFENKKKGVFTTAIAGVTMNLIIAFIAFGLLSLLLLVPLDKVYSASTFLYLLYILFYYYMFYSILINISLIAFNLIPVYPLDGFRVIEAFAKPNNPYVRFMYQYGSYCLLGVLVFSRILPSSINIFDMYFSGVQKLVMYILNAIWGAVL